MTHSLRHRSLLLLLSLLLILAAGIVFELVGEQADKRYAPVGELIPVNGHNMHIFSMGSGSATVVFASGWKVPNPYVDFYPLWSYISKYARVVVYDRPGYGWSEVTVAPRDIDTITKEIHQLLNNAGERPPYILVGHSIGSLEVIRFAQTYPDEVNGVVLIDGSNPEMYSDKTIANSSLFLSFRVALTNWGIWVANRVGLTRLLFDFGLYASTPLGTARNGLSLAPSDFKNIDAATFLRVFNNANQVAEGESKELNAAKVALQNRLHIPLKIVTSQELRSYPSAWRNQLGLRNWSSNSRQVVVDGAGHAIHWSHPEVVSKEILEIHQASQDQPIIPLDVARQSHAVR